MTTGYSWETRQKMTFAELQEFCRNYTTGLASDGKKYLQLRGLPEGLGFIPTFEVGMESGDGPLSVWQTLEEAVEAYLSL